MGDKLYRDVKKTLSELNIELIDINSTFLNEADQLKYFPFREPGHYNEIGYKKVANAIFEYTSK